MCKTVRYRKIVEIKKNIFVYFVFSNQTHCSRVCLMHHLMNCRLTASRRIAFAIFTPPSLYSLLLCNHFSASGGNFISWGDHVWTGISLIVQMEQQVQLCFPQSTEMEELLPCHICTWCSNKLYQNILLTYAALSGSLQVMMADSMKELVIFFPVARQSETLCWLSIPLFTISGKSHAARGFDTAILSCFLYSVLQGNMHILSYFSLCKHVVKYFEFTEKKDSVF